MQHDQIRMVMTAYTDQPPLPLTGEVNNINCLVTVAPVMGIRQQVNFQFSVVVCWKQENGQVYASEGL